MCCLDHLDRLLDPSACSGLYGHAFYVSASAYCAGISALRRVKAYGLLLHTRSLTTDYSPVVLWVWSHDLLRHEKPLGIASLLWQPVFVDQEAGW